MWIVIIFLFCSVAIFHVCCYTKVTSVKCRLGSIIQLNAVRVILNQKRLLCRVRLRFCFISRPRRFSPLPGRLVWLTEQANVVLYMHSEKCNNCKTIKVLKNAVFWDVAPPAHAGSSLADFSTLKMEAIRSSETSVHTKSSRRQIPEDGILRKGSNWKT
jgi:hypothetical protein